MMMETINLTFIIGCFIFVVIVRSLSHLKKPQWRKKQGEREVRDSICYLEECRLQNKFMTPNSGFQDDKIKLI